MNALRFVGVFDERWSKASLEFEVWVRLATQTDILYVPEIFSKYAHHGAQLSHSGARVSEEIEARLDIIRTRLFGPGTYFGDDDYQRDVFCLLQLINLHRHLSDCKPEEANAVLHRIEHAGYLGEFNAMRTAHLALGLPPEDIFIFSAPIPARPEPRYIIPKHSTLGIFYRAITPGFIRGMIPDHAKRKIARVWNMFRKSQ